MGEGTRKILVIGGTRFVGKRLVNELLGKGHAVTLLTRGKSGDDFGERVGRITADRRELAEGHAALGDGKWDVVYDQVCYDAHEARGASAAFRGRAGLYVFTSSLSVYGLGADLREAAFDPRAHAFEKEVGRDADYGEAKRQAEAVFSKADLGCPVVIPRFPIVMGEDDYTGRLRFHIDRVRLQRPIYVPDATARLSFIHAADAAGFLASLAGLAPDRAAAFAGPINVCSRAPVAVGTLIGQIEDLLERRAVLVREKGAGEASPYGVQSDWFMNTDRLTGLGAKCAAIHEWLPGLIEATALAALKSATPPAA